ncbi:MAG: hypothetical protein HYS24_12350 [Ignavibacteriales bacterium]|nr:hypothetical protein [Ignavibacteriales bacterium]
MKNFSGSKRTDRKKNFGQRVGRDFERSSERPLMHRATCDHCGKDCEVPFKPTSGKPIYCSSCFDKNQNRDQKKFGYERADKKFGGGDLRKKDYNSENVGNSEHLKKEIAQLNGKLDKILDILNAGLNNTNYQKDFEAESEMPIPEKKTRKKVIRKKSE